MNIEGIKGHQRQIRNLEFLLKSNKIPQAVLFTGASGIGKKLLAKRFLNSFFCQESNSPCLSCPACRQIACETFPDFIEIHPNEKGVIPIGSEDIREAGSVRWLIDRLSAKSVSGKKAILIDGIDRITEEGQNALLKTIEEPSQGTCFILITSNRNNLLPTILSRCTEIRFFPLSNQDVKEIMLQKDFSDFTDNDPDISDLIVTISGGSIEIAEILECRDIFTDIIEACKAISFCFKEDKILEVDFGIIQKKIKIELFLDIIINIFRQNLLMIIRKNKNFHPLLKDFFINDEKKILDLLKVLIALKKTEIYHLNIKYSLKGLLYSLLNN
ncbi:MAG: AAA family ATPase [Spirochaetes bacterium]|nr:AAA family ATPase [Spirochaetota bacterium]